MNELLRVARSQSGLELINLAVASHNTAAKRLYESLGFQLYGRDVHALKMGETYGDEDLMVLHLDPLATGRDVTPRRSID